MKLSRLTILVIICSLTSSVAMARKPAVEEVRYLSIEEYKPVDPQSVQGYNFKNVIKGEGQREPATTQTSEPTKIKNLSDIETTDITSPIVWSFLALAFPLVMWLGAGHFTRKSLAKKISTLDNVEQLALRREQKSKQTKQEEQEQDKFKKVS